jgi:hypothetical protein
MLGAGLLRQNSSEMLELLNSTYRQMWLPGYVQG